MKIAALKEKANEVFKFNKDAEVLIGVTDGHFFLESAKSLANDHARKTGEKVFEIKRDLTSTHPEEAAEKLNAETAKKAREDAKVQDQIKADQEAKAKAKTDADAKKAKAEEATAKAKADEVAAEKVKTDEITAKNVVKFGIDLAALTIKLVTEWAAKQTDIKLLEAALNVADTKGGKAAIAERIEQLKNA